MAQAFLHLQYANLIKGSYSGTMPGGARQMTPGVNTMASQSNGKLGYTLVSWGGYTDVNTPDGAWLSSNVILLGYSHNNTFETYYPAFEPADAMQLDTKLDDGKPTQGDIIIAARNLFTNCANSGLEYNVGYSGIACGLILNSGI